MLVFALNKGLFLYRGLEGGQKNAILYMYIRAKAALTWEETKIQFQT